VIWPARSSISNKPRHTMSRVTPIGLTPLPRFTHSDRAACGGFPWDTARSARAEEDFFLSYLTPRYRNSAIAQKYEPTFLGTQGKNEIFFRFLLQLAHAPPHRAARTRDTSPATINNCAS